MKPKCRICNSSQTSVCFISQNYHGQKKLSNQEFKVFYCQNCSNYFLNNIENNPNYYQLYYQEDYYSSPNFLSKILEFFFYKKKLHEINHYFKNKNIKLLDIGCGKGEFLKKLTPNIRGIGIDINKNLTDPNIIIDDFDKHSFPNNSFDCITMWQVFEHLTNPQYTLTKIFRILKPNGLVLFDTPNSNCLAFSIGKKDFFHLDSPRHLFIPNPQNISKLLTWVGFKNINIHSNIIDYPLDLFWSVRNSATKYLIYPLYPVFKILNPSTITIRSTKQS